MNEFGTGKGIDFWTIAKMIVGILIFVLIIAGIVSVAGPFVDNIGAADTTASGTVESGTIFMTAEKTREFYKNADGKIGIYYSADNIPETMVLYENSLYASDIKIEGEDISFLLTNTWTDIKLDGLYLHTKISPTITLGNDIEIPYGTTVEISTNGQITEFRKEFMPGSPPLKIEEFKIDTTPATH